MCADFTVKENDKANLHAGHRNRLRERFLKTGMDAFEDHEALELLLFYGIARRNVNPLAHELIRQFGSLHALFEAPVDELSAVEGVGKNTAILIKLITALGRRYEISRTSHIEVIDSTEKAGKYLIPRLSAQRDEVVYMVCLDSRYKILDCRQMFRGSVNSAGVNMRKLVENALSFNAVSVILAHNHISGVKQPSREDIECTKRVGEALRHIDINFVDHIIVAGHEYVSMADMGMM